MENEGGKLDVEEESLLRKMEPPPMPDPEDTRKKQLEMNRVNEKMKKAVRRDYKKMYNRLDRKRLSEEAPASIFDRDVKRLHRDVRGSEESQVSVKPTWLFAGAVAAIAGAFFLTKSN